MLRRKLAIGLVVVILLAGCGGGNLLKSVRLALAASGPLLDALVTSGAIPQNVATNATRDFAEGVDAALRLEQAFREIPKDDPYAKQKKLSASVAAMRDWRVIVERQNFAQHPRIQTAANIADGIFATLVVFYSEPGEMRAEAGRISIPVNEKELETSIKQQVEQLEAAFKV